MRLRANLDLEDTSVETSFFGIAGGHTALMRAAMKGRLEVVKVLVARGANLHVKNPRNKTVLQLVEKRKNLVPIKEFIEQAMKNAPTRSAERAVANRPSKKRESSEANGKPVDLLAEACRGDEIPHPSIKGCRMFSVKRASSAAASRACNKIQQDMFERFLNEGQYLIKTYNTETGIRLCLVPTKSKYEVVRRMKTNGKKYDLSNRNLIKFLRRIADDQEFDLIECSALTVGLRFLTKVKTPTKLARELCEISPSVMEEYGDSISGVAHQLKTQGTIQLGWP